MFPSHDIEAKFVVPSSVKTNSLFIVLFTKLNLLTTTTPPYNKSLSIFLIVFSNSLLAVYSSIAFGLWKINVLPPLPLLYLWASCFVNTLSPSCNSEIYPSYGTYDKPFLWEPSTDFFDFDLIKDCFLEENEYLIKDYSYLKNGHYLLEALLTFTPAQIGDYPPLS